MYAVVDTGGKQYKVRKGEVFRVEKLPGEVGAPVAFDKVLMVSDGQEVQVGQPVLDGMAVEGHIVEQGKAKKILVFKYKRRKRYRRKQGHRQPYTAVKIDRIGAPGAEEEADTTVQEAASGKTETPPEASPAAAETAPERSAPEDRGEGAAAGPGTDPAAESRPEEPRPEEPRPDESPSDEPQPAEKKETE